MSLYLPRILSSMSRSSSSKWKNLQWFTTWIRQVRSVNTRLQSIQTNNYSFPFGLKVILWLVFRSCSSLHMHRLPIWLLIWNWTVSSNALPTVKAALESVKLVCLLLLRFIRIDLQGVTQGGILGSSEKESKHPKQGEIQENRSQWKLW